MAAFAALRDQADAAQKRVDDLRVKFAADPTDNRTGRQLLNARAKASAALAALWEVVPEEKPPTQRIL